MKKSITITHSIITQPGQPVPAIRFHESIEKFKKENGVHDKNTIGVHYYCNSVFIPRAEIPISNNTKGAPILKQVCNIIQTTFCCTLEWEAEDEIPEKEDIKLKIDKDEQ